MEYTLSRTSRAKSEIRRRAEYTWSEAAIDIRCRIFLSKLDFPWATVGADETWTPVEEIHAFSEYPLLDDNFCNACQKYWATRSEYHPDGTALIQAASEGCRLCRMVLDSFEKGPTSRDILLELDHPVVLETRVSDSGVLLTAGYENSFTYNDQQRYLKSHKTLAIIDDFHPSIGRGKAATIEFIGEMMKTCLREHENCPNTLMQPLPLRLIDVGSPGGDAANQPRLWLNPFYEESGSAQAALPPSGVYTALSYCWGGVSFLNLKPDSVETLRQGIPMERLPATLQDAIEITRGLGIRYMWVDALCILQGESEAARVDWSQQSIQMDTIYSRAAVVLGVATSSSAFDGIERWPYHYDEIVELSHIQKEPQWRRVFVVSTEFKEERVVGPLHQRGWTFQERILATRFVHIGREKLFFECDNGRQFEYYANDQFQFKLGNRLGSRSDSELWHDLVEEYSRRLLSVPTDNLIAVSGIAKHFAEKNSLSGKYLAGLWETTLVKDLMWVAKSPVERINVAPSWSWASRRTEVTYEHVRRHFCGATCAKLVSSDVTNFPGLYGFRCSGKIQLKGYLRKIFLLGDQDRFDILGFAVPTSDEDTQDAKHVIGTCVIDFPSTEGRLERIAARFPREEYWRDVFATWCLPLHGGRGLLLEPSGQNENEFHRMGYFEYKEQRYGLRIPLKDWACNRDPLSHAAHLAEHPFRWIEVAMESDQDDLVIDWFGDSDAVVTLA